MSSQKRLTQSSMRMPMHQGGVGKIATGIEGLDEVLDGGLPQGRLTLVLGSAGSGKTVLLNSFLYHGIRTFGERGVFVTMEESVEDIIRNVTNFGWDYAELTRQKKLAFVDIAPSTDRAAEANTDYDLSPILQRIIHAIKKIKAKRVVIDSSSALFSRFSNQEAVRRAIYDISEGLRELDVTTLLSGESSSAEKGFSRYGVEEFVSDGVIELDLVRGQQQFLRKLYVRKLRGTSYRSGIIEYEINPRGIRVFPKVPIENQIAKTNYSHRKSTGVDGLDPILDGGIPQGHMVLISGNTGTGKSMFGMQFLIQGIKDGEKGIFVALEEPVEQVKKTATAHGWDFKDLERKGQLAFVTSSLLDVSSDKLLGDILAAVERLKAKRVVIDSVSSLLSATMDHEQVRQFLIQLTSSLKARGVTCLMNYLSAGNFGAAKGQLLSILSTNDMRLSSVTDGVIMLLYVERGQRVKKLLSILKLRGSNHSKDLFQYDIEKGRIRLGLRYEE